MFQIKLVFCEIWGFHGDDDDVDLGYGVMWTRR
jgi:hypothetical protein